jgi:uncharacterized protein YcbX
MTQEVVVRELWMYPVKGCQGSRVEEARITKSGFADDRIFTLLHEGEPLGQIKTPQLGGLGVEWFGDEKRLVFSHAEKGRYEHVRRESGDLVPGKYVLDHFETTDQGDEVAAWLTDTVGREVRLVSAAQPWSINLPHPQFDKLHQTEKSRFYPVSPVSLSNLASLEDLNRRLKTPVPMNRFRMNMVIDGLAPWDEERIEKIGSSSLQLEGVTVAERCIIITTDQETGERKKSDVLRTLGKFHRRPKGERFGSGLVFGTYLAVAQEGVVKVGDRLTVELAH